MKTNTALFGLAAVWACAITHASTIGYWRFEASAPFDDSSGNGLALTSAGAGFGDNAVAAPGFPDPVPRNGSANARHAFTLGGSVVEGPNPQELRLADDPLLPTGDFSIEAMVRWGVEVINNPVNGDIVTQWASGQQAFRWLINANNEMAIGLASSDATAFFTTGASFTFVANNDYYVAAVVDFEPDNATAVTFYVQDLTAGTPLQMIPGVTGASNLPTGLRDSTADLIIGGAASFNPESYGPRIDEVRLSSGLLAESELLISAGSADPVEAYLAGFGLTGDDLELDADVEGDGLPNALEYLMQLDPTAVDSLAVYGPRVEIVGGKVVFTYLQDATAAADFSAVTATGSDNLTGFSTLVVPAEYTRSVSAGTGPGGLDEVSHTSVPDATDAGVLDFYRVEIE